jgi:hypothetical protein
MKSKIRIGLRDGFAFVIIGLITTIVIPVISLSQPDSRPSDFEAIDKSFTAKKPPPVSDLNIPDESTKPKKSSLIVTTDSTTGRPKDDLVSPTMRSMSVVDSMVEDMKEGFIVYISFCSSKWEEKILIQMILSLGNSMENLLLKLRAKGEKKNAKIMVWRRMEADLQNPDFQIIKLTPKIQAIASQEITKWQWELTPKKPGSHRLHLAINAHFNVEGISTPRSIQTFGIKIDVKTTFVQRGMQFFKQNWQWLCTAIFIPLVYFVGKRMKIGFLKFKKQKDDLE